VPLAVQHPEHPAPAHAHAPLEQAAPDAQALHAAPFVPHSEPDCDA
jgi:hypothetical protein